MANTESEQAGHSQSGDLLQNDGHRQQCRSPPQPSASARREGAPGRRRDNAVAATRAGILQRLPRDIYIPFPARTQRTRWIVPLWAVQETASERRMSPDRETTRGNGCPIQSPRFAQFFQKNYTSPAKNKRLRRSVKPDSFAIALTSRLCIQRPFVENTPRRG